MHNPSLSLHLSSFKTPSVFSLMEPVGAAASILAIAGAGIQISLKLIAFADRVATASKRIQDVGTEVSVTAGTLQDLGELMKQIPNKRSTGLFKPDQVQIIVASSTKCEGIFNELKEILSRSSHQLRDVYKSSAKSHETSPRIELSKWERMKWPFLQPSMEPLESALRDTKGTLTLILQVVHLRHAQKTASLDQEEQLDLIRTIAAMQKQQLLSVNGNKSGHKGLEVSETEDSDAGESSETRTCLEAWSIIPNTLSDKAFEHFLITPIPVSQQQIANLMRKSPQDLGEIASIIDSLSFPERDAIFDKVLDERRIRFDESTIRSIDSQRWTGSHDLFGKVAGRKFQVIIERQTRRRRRSRNILRRHRVIHSREKEARSRGREDREYQETPYSHVDDSFSDFDDVHETKAYTHESSPSPPPRRHRRRPAAAHSRSYSDRERRRPNQGPPKPSFERKRLRGDDEWKQEQEEKERRKEEEMIKEKLLKLKKLEAVEVEKGETEHQRKWENHSSQPWAESQPSSEPSDDELVKSLLAQYTNFDPGEPLVQSIATPPPSYEEAFVIPKRVPRPY